MLNLSTLGASLRLFCLTQLRFSFVALALLLAPLAGAKSAEAAAEFEPKILLPDHGSQATSLASDELTANPSSDQLLANQPVTESGVDAPVGDTAEAALAESKMPVLVPAGDPNQATALPLENTASVEYSDAEATAMFRVSDLEAALEENGRVRTTATDLAQVTQVSQFTDVLPSDWAYQALSSLVENYGCIQGYPDRTFRGQRSLTRFEFAAGLNACLDVIVTTLGGLDQISAEDLAAISRLQEEFAAELATIKGRVDILEADVAQLRAQQFSTVTKLRGQAWMNMAFGFANGPVLAEGINVFVGARDPVTGQPVVRTIDRDPGTTVSGLTWLNFDTSFTGKDRLRIQLAAGAGTGPGNLYASAGLFNTFGVPFTFQNGSPNAWDVTVREFSYLFPVGSNLTVDIGPRINW
ncbi:MAG TPA: carbohydrate porin, partial [Leptolyngbyaceae cyanobacterium M65_K2018_010]|nr:carbohydrate porin [Leptolyngbyaceae cyanobacterium M65_K2018_010]